MIYPHAKEQLLKTLKTPRINETVNDKLLHNNRVYNYGLRSKNNSISPSKNDRSPFLDKKLSTYHLIEKLMLSTGGSLNAKEFRMTQGSKNYVIANDNNSSIFDEQSITDSQIIKSSLPELPSSRVMTQLETEPVIKMTNITTQNSSINNSSLKSRKIKQKGKKKKQGGGRESSLGTSSQGS